MAKKLNKNMVAALTVFGFVLMTAAGVLMVNQLRRTDPVPFDKKGDAAAEAGEYKQANIYYNRAFSVSKEAKYLVKAGEMFRQMGEERKALRVWESALVTNPTLMDAYHKILDVYFETAERGGGSSQRLWLRIKEKADAALENDDQDPQALYAQGRALVALKAQDETYDQLGMAALKRASEIAPENVTYRLEYAAAKARGGRKDETEEQRLARQQEAEAVFKELLEAHQAPGHEAFLVRGRYAERLQKWGRSAEIRKLRADTAKRQAEEAGRDAVAAAEEAKVRQAEAESAQFYDQALRMYNDALALVGDEPEDQGQARVQLAEYWYQRMFAQAFVSDDQAAADQALDTAIRLLNEAIEVDPEGFAQCLLLADVYVARDMYDEAIEVCRTRAEREISRKGLKAGQRKIGRYQVLVKAADLCVAQVARLPQGTPQREERLQQAEAFVADAHAEIPDLPLAYTAEGRILVARGKDLDALAKFEAAHDANRDTRVLDWKNDYYLASLYLADEQVGSAREAILAAVQDPRARAEAWIVCGQIMLKTREYARVVESAQHALLRSPDNLAALRILAEAYRKMEKTGLLEETLAKIRSLTPDDPVLQARTLSAEERYDEALAALAPALEAEEIDVRVVSMAVRVYIAMGQRDEARAVVQRAIEKAPEEVGLRKIALNLDENLTPEEAHQARLALVKEEPDALTRNLQLADLHLGQSEWDLADAALIEAGRLLDELATDAARELARRQGERAARTILDQRFVLSFRRANESEDQADWAKAEAIAAEANKRNIDGVEGLTFYGRLQLLQKQPAQAAESFRRALEMQPRNSMTLIFLAQAHLDLRQNDQAREAFERAIDINPTNGQAYKGLAMLAEVRRDDQMFLKYIRPCFELIPNDPWVKLYEQRVTEVDDPATGIERRLKTREEKPDDYQNILRLAGLYAHEDINQIEAAKRCLDDVLRLAPDEPRVIWQVASFYQQHDEPARGLEILQQALASRTENDEKITAQLQLGDYYMLIGDPRQAETAYLAAADIERTLPACVAVGNFYTKANRPDVALEWLTEAIAKAEAEKHFETPRIRAQQIECLIKLRQLDRASELTDRLESVDGSVNTALLLRAETERQRGDLDKAIELLSLYLENLPKDAQGLYRRARCYAGQGRWNPAIMDLVDLRANHPDAFDLEPRRMLARAYDLTGQPGLAFSELESLLEQNPNNQTIAQSLINLRLEKQHYDEANEIAIRMSNRYPQSPFWFQVRGAIALARQRDEENRRGDECAEALQHLDRAAQLSGFRPDMVARFLQGCAQCEAHERGIAFYENAVPQERRIPGVTGAYASLLANAGRAEEAIVHWREAAARLPALSVSFAGQVAQDAIAAVGQDRALELLREPPADESQRRFSRLMIAAALQLSQSYSEASSIIEELLATATVDTEKAELTMLAGIVAGQAGNFEDSRRFYEDLLTREPTQWQALNNLAYILGDKLDQPEAALPYAQKAAALTQEPAVLDTLGTVYLKLGRGQDAIAVLSSILDQNTDYVPAYVHQAAAHRLLGKFPQAEDLLVQAQKLVKPGFYEEYAAEITAELEKVQNRDTKP